MSFRTRLTLLYAMITGGMLLIFGVLIYFLIDTLINQEINATLESTYQSIQGRLNIDSSGRVYLSQLPTGTIDAHVYVQVWDMDGNLSNASGELADLNQPLDPGNFAAIQPTRGEITLDNVHLRVLTVPLIVEGRRTIGVVQVATPLVIPDLVKRTVLVVLIFATAFFTGLSALVAWGSLGQILIPLRTATATANQVVHADDLSRRIPYSGRPDEIGQLIEAFNRSLARSAVFNASSASWQMSATSCALH
jgi:methyl-accepting chemotaxis protein